MVDSFSDKLKEYTQWNNDVFNISIFYMGDHRLNLSSKKEGNDKESLFKTIDSITESINQRMKFDLAETLTKTN